MRGFRVELSEIEKCVRSYQGITEATVIKSVNDKEEFILAYYVTKDGSSVNQTELIAYLKQLLPNYMIPNRFVSVGAIPYNTNGKVDLGSLPLWQDNRQESLYEKPQSEEERKIYDVWQRSLGVQFIDINDNFFDIGGHSLLLSQVHYQLKELFGDGLSIVDMFNYPTIKALAEHISQKENRDSFQSIIERSRKQRQAFAREARNRI